MTLVEIAPGLWVAPEHVAVVKEAAEEGKCVVFTAGQSAVDGGFLVDEEAQVVVDDLEEAMEKEEEDDGQAKEK